MTRTTEHGLPLPDDDGQVLLLLCTALATPVGESEPRPFKLAHWSSLTERIASRGLNAPGELLRLPPAALRTDLGLPEETAERVSHLLSRAGSLALAVRALADKGLWVLPHTDPRYPALLREHLGSQAPPALYGAGDVTLLMPGGLAVVGSRDADEPARACATRLGQAAAQHDVALISGGARGIDREAMSAALEAGGQALGVLPADLERTALTRENRALIADQRLLLCSAEPPAARWQTWRAMARNKLLYGLARAAVVVHAAAGEGGTWQGATEALKAAQVPVWVRCAADAPPGNAALADRGARPLDDTWLAEHTLTDLFAAAAGPASRQLSLFD